MSKKSFFQKKPMRGLLLTVSSMSALGLFLTSSTLMLLMLLGVFSLMVLNGIFHRKDPVKPIFFSPGAFILALTFAGIGFFLFPHAMAYHNRMTGIAEALHISYMLNARILAFLLALLGFYAFYRLSMYLEEILCNVCRLPGKIQGTFPKSNLLFSLSALGFFLLEPQWDPILIVSAAGAVAFSLVISLHCPEFSELILQVKGSRRLLAALTALGIAIFRAKEADAALFSIGCAALSLPFLFVCLCLLYGWLDVSFERLHTFEDLQKQEKLLYLCLFLAAAFFAAAVFFKTDAFYETPYDFDVIYTADSPRLVQENAYLSLRHPENDLRQPLFAVFAAPFTGLAYLLSCFLPKAQIMRPLLLNLSQILLLLFTNFLLARILNLNCQKRMLFMALTSFSYPVLLFFLMMEQYIIVYFWLIFAVYLILRKDPGQDFSLFSAGGTLLTSLILMPAMGQHHPIRELKAWFSRMLQLAGGFAAALLFFGRLDILLDAPTQILSMLQFSGQKLTLLQKLQQYLGFFRQCLTAPPAAADLTAMGHPSWQLLIPSGISLLSIGILLLAVISILLNRKDSAVKASGWWLCFSFLLLFLVGWGTQENGLILYTLYFGWALWIPLFRLLEKLGGKNPHHTMAAGMLCLAAEILCNLPALYKLISFAVFYYPI